MCGRTARTVRREGRTSVLLYPYQIVGLRHFKRAYTVELSDANAGGPLRKIAYIDLMSMADPNKLACKPLNNGVLTFPFFTIKNVDVVDATQIVVGNDNNLPFSSSREPNKADDNELVLLEVGEFLRAK